MSRRRNPFDYLRRGLTYATGVLRETYEAWRDDRAIRLGAGLAYYGLLALVPLLILAVVLASLVFSTQEIEEYVAAALEDTIGSEVEEFSEEFSEEISDEMTLGSFRGGLGILGLVALIIAASFLFLALEDALKVIWHEPVRPGFRNSLKRRGLAALIALLAGSLLLAGLIITTLLGVAQRIAPNVAIIESATHAVLTVAMWALGVAFLAVLIQLLVRRRVSWLALLIGGAVTAVTLNIGTGLVWGYLETSGTRGVTGVAGGIILILVWIYYVAQMFIAGAELTKVIDWRLNPPEGTTAD